MKEWYRLTDIMSIICNMQFVFNEDAILDARLSLYIFMVESFSLF